jgi:hypothetical protein
MIRYIFYLFWYSDYGGETDVTLNCDCSSPDELMNELVNG